MIGLLGLEIGSVNHSADHSSDAQLIACIKVQLRITQDVAIYLGRSIQYVVVVVGLESRLLPVDSRCVIAMIVSSLSTVACEPTMNPGADWLAAQPLPAMRTQM